MKVCKCKSYFRKLIQYCRGTVFIVGEHHLWKLSVELWCNPGWLFCAHLLDIKFYGVNYFLNSRDLAVVLIQFVDVSKTENYESNAFFSVCTIFMVGASFSATGLIGNKRINDK